MWIFVIYLQTQLLQDYIISRIKINFNLIVILK